MRAAVVALAAVTLGGCSQDPCAGVDGTCVALTVTGHGSVDGVAVTLSGAASGTRVVPSVATPHPLPVAVALQLPPSLPSTLLHVSVVGVLLGEQVGTGHVDVTVTPGAHTTATVSLTGIGAAAPDGGPTGTRVVHYVLGDGGVVDVPANFTSGVRPSALIGGSGTPVLATGDAKGNFTIANLPSSAYFLRFQRSWLYTTATSGIDFGEWLGGRPDQTPATTSTTLGFDVSNLAPWDGNATLELFSLNAGLAVFGIEGLVAGASDMGSGIPSGATTLGGSIDLSQTGGALVDAAKGDDVFLLQLAGDNNNGVPYQRAARIVHFAPFSIGNGGTHTLTASATTLTPSSMLAIDWRRSRYEELRPQVSPNATVSFDNLDLFALPGPMTAGVFLATPDLANANPPNGANDLTFTMSYADPFPSSWPLVLVSESVFAVSYALPGLAATTQQGIVSNYAPLAGVTMPLAPTLGPVQSPTLDGQNAFTASTVATATPQIAWQPPLLGTPSGYIVTLHALVAGTSGTLVKSVATFHTQLLGFTMPPGLMSPGGHYFFTITAVTSSVDQSRAPLASALPVAFADALTAAVVVPGSPPDLGSHD